MGRSGGLRWGWRRWQGRRVWCLAGSSARPHTAHGSEAQATWAAVAAAAEGRRVLGEEGGGGQSTSVWSSSSVYIIITTIIITTITITTIITTIIITSSLPSPPSSSRSSGPVTVSTLPCPTTILHLPSLPPAPAPGYEALIQHPVPSPAALTPYPEPYTCYPGSSTLSPKPYTPYPEPYTCYPGFSTLSPYPCALPPPLTNHGAADWRGMLRPIRQQPGGL